MGYGETVHQIIVEKSNIYITCQNENSSKTPYHSSFLKCPICGQVLNFKVSVKNE